VAGLAFSEWRDAAADAGYYEVRRTEHLRRLCTTQHNESTATIHFITGSMLLKYVFLLVTLCSAAAAQCTVTLNPSSVHLSSAKSTGTFAISASTANCPRTVKSNSDWISIAFGQTGNGTSGSAGYTIDNSTLYTSRTGTVTVATGTSSTVFTVTQDAYPCTYTFNPVNQAVQPDGGNFTLGVVTACTWSASTTTPWIALNAGMNGTGNGTLSYTIQPNNVVASRVGSIRVNNQDYSVTQFGTGCNYTVTPTQANYTSKAAAGTLMLQTDSSCPWSIDSPPAWINNFAINGTPGMTASGGATITYNVDANTSSLSRSGTVTVGNQQINITQTGVGILLTAQSVVNGASFLSGQIAPGELITIFGSALGPQQPLGLQLTADGQSVTSSLGGVRVLFDGVAAPLTYVSDGQINAIVPFGLAGDVVMTKVQVEVQGVASSPVTEFLTSASPALFTAYGGSGQAAALNQDNSANAIDNPAPIGSVLQLFITGAGQTNPPGVDGQLAGSAPWIPQGQVTATIGGVDALVQYAGSSSGLVAGVTQVNVVVPDGTPTGDAVPIIVTVGGNPSPSGVTVAIR
jgi:uncharacterized protein (TIGR03437 family)